MNDAPVPFCSEACRDAEAGDEIVREHGYKRFPTGVALDALVPRGIPSDAFVVLAGDEGARRSELATELVRRALTRGEPAVIVAFTDPPIAVLERFFTSSETSSRSLRWVSCGSATASRIASRIATRSGARATTGASSSAASPMTPSSRSAIPAAFGR